MSSSKDGFESVKGAEALWNPCQTGSKKTNDLVKLTAGDDSYLIGWYLGTRVIDTGNNQTSNMHEIQVKEVGDETHISGEFEANGRVDVWGSAVLDDLISKKVTPGQCILITWEGLKQSQKAGGNDYHGWDVGVNPAIEPIQVAGGIPGIPATKAPETTKVPAGTGGLPGEAPNAGTAVEEEDDDSHLPF